MKRIIKGICESLKELKIFKVIFKNILYFMVAVLYLIDHILDKFYDIVVYIYGKLHKRLQKFIFYLLVIMAYIGVYSITNTNTLANAKTTQNKQVNNKIEYVKEDVAQPTPEVKENICDMDQVSCKIKAKAEEKGIDYKIAIAIAKHETGNYTSEAFKTRNNVGGMMCNNTLMRFDTLDLGIESFVNNLKTLYFDLGLDTIEKIQPKYCPIGAANDPKGLNKNWLPGVTKYYNEMN